MALLGVAEVRMWSAVVLADAVAVVEVVVAPVPMLRGAAAPMEPAPCRSRRQLFQRTPETGSPALQSPEALRLSPTRWHWQPVS
mmetsp:Transcript_117868/g.333403  ORF Transcript_117868/g.333403 Transcript_117868/m.333403 type:complete len:84 (-) Transcript_117868:386-637(-)